MKSWNVELAFRMDCYTRGYTIEAETAEEARKKVEACIDEHGYIDWEKAEAAGLNTGDGTWAISDGSDHAYEVNEVEEDEE